MTVAPRTIHAPVERGRGPVGGQRPRLGGLPDGREHLPREVHRGIVRARVERLEDLESTESVCKTV